MLCVSSQYQVVPPFKTGLKELCVPISVLDCLSIEVKQLVYVQIVNIKHFLICLFFLLVTHDPLAPFSIEKLLGSITDTTQGVFYG
jgi:hypothetical protein